MNFDPWFPLAPLFSGAAPSSTAYLWWSTRWTARVRRASTRRPSGEIPPGIACPRLPERYPEARPLRAPTACSVSRSSSSTRQLSREAPPLTGSCQMGPGAHFSPLHLSSVVCSCPNWHLLRVENNTLMWAVE